MVKLNQIYTRTGDKGQTGLGDGTRVPKHDLQVAAYGTVDETNAAIGLAQCHAKGDIRQLILPTNSGHPVKETLHKSRRSCLAANDGVEFDVPTTV